MSILTYMTANVRLGKNVYLAPTAYVGGDVVLGDECTVMHHACIRGDIAPIRLGRRVNVQDGSILHTRAAVPLEVADNVAIGHRVVLHCRSVASWSLIGSGAIVLDDAVIGSGCLIAAGSVVTPGTHVPDGKLAAGVPATIRRDLTDADRAEIERIVLSYVETGNRHSRGEFPNVCHE